LYIKITFIYLIPETTVLWR